MNILSSHPRLGEGELALNPKCLERLYYEEPDLSTTLGFTCTYLAKGIVEAQFKVTKSCCRGGAPVAMLHGGVSLAFAETCAGIGSMCVCPLDMNPCGIQVSANHLHMAFLGEILTAKCKLINQGSHLHLWEVNIYNEQEKLISSAHVTNMLVPIKRP